MGPWEGVLTVLLLQFLPPSNLISTAHQMTSLPSVAFQCPSDKIILPSRSPVIWPPASASTSFSSKKLSGSFSFFHLEPLCLPMLLSQPLNGWHIPQRGRAWARPPFFLSTTWGILVPQPGIEPAPPAVEVWSPNNWTAREVLFFFFFLSCFFVCFLLSGFFSSFFLLIPS